MQGAKDELTALWSNKKLASKDFIKFVEQYRTLACIVDYEDMNCTHRIVLVWPHGEIRISAALYATDVQEAGSKI